MNDKCVKVAASEGVSFVGDRKEQTMGESLPQEKRGNEAIYFVLET